MLKLDTKVTVDYISGFDIKPEFQNDYYVIWQSTHGYILTNKKGEYFILTAAEYHIFISQYEDSTKMLKPMG